MGTAAGPRGPILPIAWSYAPCTLLRCGVQRLQSIRSRLMQERDHPG